MSSPTSSRKRKGNLLHTNLFENSKGNIYRNKKKKKSGINEIFLRATTPNDQQSIESLIESNDAQAIAIIESQIKKVNNFSLSVLLY